LIWNTSQTQMHSTPHYEVCNTKYEVWLWSSRNDLIASIPVYLQFTGEGSSSKFSPWAAMHLAQWCCHCWKHFWNSCCGIGISAVFTFFWMSSVSWNHPLSKAGFISWNSQKWIGTKSEEYHGCSISVIDFWARNCLTVPCELEHCCSGESNHWTKVQAFFTHSFT